MHPDDPQYSLFLALHGASVEESPFRIGKIPAEVAELLGWRSRDVMFTNRDAQKLRHHPMHGMDANRALHLPMVLSNGDYWQTRNRGTELQIEVVLHEPDQPNRAYFLVLARDKEDRGIFIRTFYFTAKLTRSKMKRAVCIRDRSGLAYFKTG